MRKSLRFAILTRDRFRCRYCGRGPADVELEIDHVEPRRLGGGNDPDNLITACRPCNRGKSGHPLPDEDALWEAASGSWIPYMDTFVSFAYEEGYRDGLDVGQNRSMRARDGASRPELLGDILRRFVSEEVR